MDSFALFDDSLKDFIKYPQNLIWPGRLSRRLNIYWERLQTEKDRLFNQGQAAVDFLDFTTSKLGSIEMLRARVMGFQSLQERLKVAFRHGAGDPQCRFIFIHAPHSRASLKISYEMLCLLFSYHQVMPTFLDFIFPFGSQVHAIDSHFSGLRRKISYRNDKRLEICDLGRSGTDVQICYNLRSVEHSISDPRLPWSVRQCAVYHSLDLETGKMVWITVKGNELFKDRINETHPLPSITSTGSCSEMLKASLDIHLIFCEWSGENWRWYINDLENKLQDRTGNALATPIDKPPTPIISPFTSPGISRAATAKSMSKSMMSPRKMSRQFTPMIPSRAETMVDNRCLQNVSDVDYTCEQSDWMNIRTVKKNVAIGFTALRKYGMKGLWKQKKSYQFPTPVETQGNVISPEANQRADPPELPPVFSIPDVDAPERGFTFSDLQSIQYIEEKAQDALTHLQLNIKVLEELRQTYRQELSQGALSNEIRTNFDKSIAKFDEDVHGIEKDLKLLISRTETLLQLVGNRKALLNGILQYRSVKANEFFAKNAQSSATHMELLTREMHGIAKKTEKETVSMRVITTVTLFFLPATFLATFMSTDILRFDNGNRKFQIEALVIYLEIALPLTALTFLAWWFIYHAVEKSRNEQTQKTEERV